MRRLLNYKYFIEKLVIDPSDEPDIKLAKEELNKLEKNLKDFPTIKSDIDKAFAETKGDKDSSNLNMKIENIEKKFPDNSFLIKKWVEICKLNKEISDIQNKNLKDKISLDDFNQELSLSKDSSIKQVVSFKISEIKTRMSFNSSEIVNKTKEIQKKEAETKAEMDKIKRDIVQNTQRINDIKQK